MTEEIVLNPARAVGLRRAFDRSFAEALQSRTEGVEGIVACRVGGDRFAVRLRDIAGVIRTANLVPVPSKQRALLGLAGIRGALVPIFSLADLLGYASHEEVWWILLCEQPARVGLAVGEFEGCLQVPETAFRVTDSPTNLGNRRELAVVGSCAYTVISVSNLVKSIRNLEEGH